MPNVATADTVSREELLDFLRPRHNGIYVARRGDGRPQLSPVSCGIDPEGRIVVSTYPQRAKTRNTRRDPEVSICVLSADFGGAVDLHPGPAEVVGEDADGHFGVAAGIPRLRPLRVRRHHDAALGINAAAHRGELRPPVPAPGHVDPLCRGRRKSRSSSRETVSAVATLGMPEMLVPCANRLAWPSGTAHPRISTARRHPPRRARRPRRFRGCEGRRAPRRSARRARRPGTPRTWP